jgi:sulfoxide reductase catalytic subunit YedY
MTPIIMTQVFPTPATYPWWLRINHFVNILFIGLMIRSGIQILAAHPRLYWNDGCRPSSNWLNFTHKKIPKGQQWTSMDEEVPVSPLIAQPGKDNLGLGRHWHFFALTFWVLNGAIYIIALFTSGEWRTLIPTSWTIFPAAWHTFVTYASMHLPPESSFTPLDPLQQLIYAAVVYLLAPLQILTGAAMSPSIAARFPWYIRIFGGRQVARSLHFLGLVAFIIFTILHTVLIFVVRFPNNVRDIVLGNHAPTTSVSLAIVIGGVALLFVFAFYAVGTWYSLHYKHQTQDALGTVVDPLRKLSLHRIKSKQRYTQDDITPYFWVNGRVPDDEEYAKLAANHFVDWRLEIKGLVLTPMQLSLEDLHKLPKETQITKHNCIQGWSGVGEWGGVPVKEVLKLCGALPQAKYLVFTSMQKGRGAYPHGEGEERDIPFYEVIDMTLANHHQTILAYEFNGRPLPIDHGAPLRLRVETVLGYKQAKWLRSIELVEDYRAIGKGHGGYREDYQYYGRGAEI